MRPAKASPQWEEVGVVVGQIKEFRSERASGVAGLICNSQLPFLRELTACLAVYHARVSTWAESVEKHEELKLDAGAFVMAH